MKIYMLLFILKAFAAPPPITVYTICFNSGAKCHSIYDDHTQGSLNGNVLGSAKLTSQKTSELRKRLDSILLSAKQIGTCSDFEYSKIISGKKVADKTYCYEEFPMATKNDLAKWVKSLPRIKASAPKPQMKSRIKSPFES